MAAAPSHDQLQIPDPDDPKQIFLAAGAELATEFVSALGGRGPSDYPAETWDEHHVRFWANKLWTEAGAMGHPEVLEPALVAAWVDRFRCTLRRPFWKQRTPDPATWHASWTDPQHRNHEGIRGDYAADKASSPSRPVVQEPPTYQEFSGHAEPDAEDLAATDAEYRLRVDLERERSLIDEAARASAPDRIAAARAALAPALAVTS